MNIFVSTLSLCVIVLTFPVPLFHIILHRWLGMWRKVPYLYYAGWGIVWIALGLFVFQKKTFAQIPLVSLGQEVRLIGFIFAALGIFLVLWSLSTIGPKRFFVWAALRPNEVEQKIITKGPFLLLRHPAYVGYQLLAFGSFLFTGWWSTFAVFVWLFLSTPFAIRLEERELAERVSKSEKLTV